MQQNSLLQNELMSAKIKKATFIVLLIMTNTNAPVYFNIMKNL